MSLDSSQLDFDYQHLWHPYTNLSKPSPVFGVESAEGVYLNLSNGQQIVDGMASWWSAIHGYNHPVLNQAIVEQSTKMSHVMFGGLTHEPAVELGRKLIGMTASELDCLFIADSGSIAVEVALKMALQFWFSQGKRHKDRFLTVKNGYHGDTFGAMSVCDPENGMHSMFSGVLPKHIFVEPPQIRDDKDWDASDIGPLKQALEENCQQIAAVIIEPLVQGAGGMRVYCAEYLRQLRLLCDEHNVLLIFDEIATGFGRTGSMFAYQQPGVVPDILCLGKAITGGYLSLAATLTTRRVADTISGFEGGNLMHGPTFMANPLACAVACKSIDLLVESNWMERVKSIEVQLNQSLEPLASLSSVSDVRVKGAIGVIELTSPVDMFKVQPRLVELGVWLRPFGKLLYTMPPYIIESDELAIITKAMEAIAVEAA